MAVPVLRKIRDLDLRAPSSPGRPRHLSAASGLVRAGSFLYVVADDELHLGVYHIDDRQAGSLIRLYGGALPGSKKKRKRRKPDSEALMLLPPFAGYAHGAMLAIGSGSRRQRCRGALLALDASGAPRGKPRVIDLSGLYDELDEHCRDLNIEGALVNGDELWLLQRGNKGTLHNAVVPLHLPAVLEALGAGDRIERIAPFALRWIDLGLIDGIPFCFTDGAALPNGHMIFTAVAENTEDSYRDGRCAGAALGIVDGAGALRWLSRLDQPYKVEGVHAQVEADAIRLLLVTDADDAAVPARLYAAKVYGYRNSDYRD